MDSMWVVFWLLVVAFNKHQSTHGRQHTTQDNTPTRLLLWVQEIQIFVNLLQPGCAQFTQPKSIRDYRSRRGLVASHVVYLAQGRAVP